MPKCNTRPSGFSIIELMVVLALLAVTLAKGIPFTVEWINSSRVATASSVMVEAVGLAKAQALRNPVGMINAGAISAVCLDNGQVQVVAAANENSPAGCANSSKMLWAQNISPNLNILAEDNSFECLCFDSKARFNTTASCDGCSRSSAFTLSLGGSSDSVEIY